MAQRKFIIDGGFSVNADSDITGNLTMTGHILPSVDSNGTTGYDLGSTTAKWRDLYLSEGSLYINNQKVIEDNSGTIVVRADADQSLTIKTEGTGVLTLQSATTVNFAGNLQMASGTSISSNDSTVTFSDKVDMDNNQIINVALPTADGHAATKKYVDDAFGDLVNGAPAALDTLNELANALGDDANFASTVTTSLATKASTTYVDDEIATAISTAASTAAAGDSALDLRVTSLESQQATNTAQITANQTAAANNATAIANNATAITTAKAEAIAQADTNADAKDVVIYNNAVSYTDAREIAISAAYNTAISVESTAIANAYATAIATSETNITVAYESYADAAEAAAVATVAGQLGDATIDGTSGNTVTDRISTAESTAISTAAADATSKADAAQAAAVATAAADATSKADAAQAAAEATAASYTDAQVAAGVANLIDAAPGALDTLNELAAAMGDDANFASTVTNSIATAKSEAISTAAADATAKANAAETAAVATAASDATTKANAAEAVAIATAAADATSKVSAEASARATAVAQAQASAEATAEAYTDAEVSAEATARASADAGLQSAINGEISNRQAGDTALDNAKAEKSVDMAAGAGLTGGGNLSASRTFNVGAGTGISVSADAVAVDVAWADARYINHSDITHVHGSPVVVTSTNSTTNDTATVALDLGQANLLSYSVYINRMLMRPTEFTYAANGVVTFSIGTLTTNDELEIVGFKAS